MRVSNSMIYNLFTRYDNKRQLEITKSTEKLASGKDILAPSDKPVDLAQSLRYKSINKDIEGYLKNMDILQSTQEVAESSLTNIVETSIETRATIVQLLNTGVFDQEDANVLKDYFKGIRDYIVNQANVQIGDKYLFSGVNSQIAPISADGVYQGASSGTSVPIAKGVEQPIRYTGYSAGGDNYLGVGKIDGGENKMIAVAVLDKIVATIESGDLSALHKSDFINIDGKDYDVLSAFDKGVDTISAHRSRIGAQQKTLEALRTQHADFTVTYNNLISNLEDVDFAKAATDLQKAKTAYEATMASYMQVKDLSLLNYFK